MDQVEAKVKFQNRETRTPLETTFMILFWFSNVVHIGLGLLISLSANKELVETGDVPPEERCYDWSSHLRCSASLIEDRNECMAKTGRGKRRLDASEEETPWDLLLNHLQIPIVSVGFIAFLSTVWIIVLRKRPHGVVWFTVALKIAVWVLLGLWFLDIGVSEQGYICFVIAGLFLAFVYWHRAKYVVAGDHLKLAMMGLLGNMKIFVYTGILEAVYLAYLGISCWMWIRVHSVWRVDYNCNFVKSEWTSKAMIYLVLQFGWTTYFFKSASLFITSMTVGDWYFGGSSESPENVPKHAFALAFTGSSGALSLAALVSSVCDYLLKEGQKKSNLANPMGFVIVVIVGLFRYIIQALTKFAIIMHAMSGLSFIKS